MSAKVLAVAIVLAGTAGAGASYFHHNPVSMQSLWASATAMRGPLTTRSSSAQATPYKRSNFHRLCQRGFAQKLRNRNSREREEACTCVDKEIVTWSQSKQDRAILAFSQITFDYGADPRMAPRSPTTPHRLSQHERNVRDAHERREKRELEREAASYVERFKDINPISVNPVTLLWSVQNLETLANRCGIMGPPPRSMKEVEERYRNIGSPNS